MKFDDNDDICANKHGGNEYSVQANDSLSPVAKGHQQFDILAELNKHYPDGMTCQEIERALKMERSSASARWSELKRDKHIEKIGTRKTSSGRKAGVWRIKRREVNVLHPD
jgi:hypothetical protein